MLDRQSLVLIVSFVTSGAISPILVQLAALNGAAQPSTMLILLPSVIGMGLSILFNLSAVGKGTIDWKPITCLTFLDLASARITLQGMIAAGSTIYTIAHCSMTLFTAIFSVLLLKRHLKLNQWLGIGIVTIGLCILGIGCRDEDKQVSFGVVLILIGSMIHSFSYIIVEYILVHSEDPIAPEVLCAILGMSGVSMNLVWQVFYTLPRYETLVVDEIRDNHGHVDTIVFSYLALMIATCINATCFYNLLGRVGSASTGVLKGLQAVATFVTSHYAFCGTQQSQCFTPLKGASLALVLCGVLIYSTGADRATDLDRGEYIVIEGASDDIDETTPIHKSKPSSSYQTDLDDVLL